jgi:hypothetical protein
MCSASSAAEAQEEQDRGQQQVSVAHNSSGHITWYCQNTNLCSNYATYMVPETIICGHSMHACELSYMHTPASAQLLPLQRYLQTATA